MKSGFFIIGLVLLIALFGITTFSHEQVHVLANERVGLDSKPVVTLYEGWLPAVGIEYSGLIERDLTNYDLIQLQNEVVNYNVTPVLFGIMMVLIMGFSEVLKRRDVKQ